MRKLFVILLTVVTLLVFSVSGFATTHYFYVDANQGSNSNENEDGPNLIGNMSHPFKTLHHALEIISLYDANPRDGVFNPNGDPAYIEAHWDNVTISHDYWDSPTEPVGDPRSAILSGDIIRISMMPGTFMEPDTCRWLAGRPGTDDEYVATDCPLEISPELPNTVRIYGLNPEYGQDYWKGIGEYAGQPEYDWEDEGNNVYSHKWPYFFEPMEPIWEHASGNTLNWLGRLNYSDWIEDYDPEEDPPLTGQIPQGRLLTHRESFYLLDNALGLVKFTQDFDYIADPNFPAEIGYFKIDYDPVNPKIYIKSNINPGTQNFIEYGKVLVPFNKRILWTEGAIKVTLDDLDFAFAADYPIGKAAKGSVFISRVLSHMDGAEVSNCSFKHNSWLGLNISGGEDIYTGNMDFIEVTSCVADSNGGMGMHTSGAVGTTLNSNSTNYNNLRGYKAGTMSWDIGGVKLMPVQNVRINNHVSTWNYARGFWIDSSEDNILIENCTFNYNYWHGLFIEYSYGSEQNPIQVKGCTIVENGQDYRQGFENWVYEGKRFAGSGIQISSSMWVDIYRNTISNNVSQIKFEKFYHHKDYPVYIPAMRVSCNISIHENEFEFGQGIHDWTVLNDWGYQVSLDRGNNNCIAQYWYDVLNWWGNTTGEHPGQVTVVPISNYWKLMGYYEPGDPYEVYYELNPDEYEPPNANCDN